MTAASIALMIVPQEALTFLVGEYGWVQQSVSFLSTVAADSQVANVVAFGVLGLLAYVAFPRRRPWHRAIVFLTLATFVEFVQISSPGRDPAVMHAVLDFVGGMAGLGMARLLNYAWGPDDQFTQSSIPGP